MKYTVRVTDGHCFRDIDIETDKGLEEACSLAMNRAKEIERTGDACCWEAFESSGRAEYVDSVSTENNRLDVPVEYRCWTERNLLHEIAELKAEIDRLRGAPPQHATLGRTREMLAMQYAQWKSHQWELLETFDKGAYCSKCDGATRIEEQPV
jgi:hypothetical protein